MHLKKFGISDGCTCPFHEKGMTMYRLSALSGVPHTTLISIINGDSKNPGIMTIKKLSDAFGISLAEFFSSELF